MFLKRAFWLHQNFAPYNSKSISHRKIIFATVGFGFKPHIPIFIKIHQNQRCSGYKKIFCGDLSWNDPIGNNKNK